MPEKQTLLKQAQKFAISGDYQNAFACLEKILSQNPDHIETLHFKGNVLELKAFDNQLNKNINLTDSPEMQEARACYEQSLILAPNHPGILTDLGTHWKNLDNEEKAADYFDCALAQIPAQIAESPENNEITNIAMEALDEKMEILRAQGKPEAARHLQAKLAQLQAPSLYKH
ncbi:MAG: hypothetical protein ACRDD3_01525 [Azovibrio sp.]